MEEDIKIPEIVTEDGEVVSEEMVRYSYTRPGRHEIGKEYPNPVPMEPPIGWVAEEPIHIKMMKMVNRELAARAEREEFEGPEEADDFDIGDDYDPTSPWEEQFEPTGVWPPAEFKTGDPETSPEEPSKAPAASPPSEPAKPLTDVSKPS